jgi:hypothetical protein
MPTPSEINALIRELKKNREDMLPKCKLKLATRYDNLSPVLGADVDCLNTSGNRWDTCVSGIYKGVIYSLPFDFPEVPEVTEGWVQLDVDDVGLMSIFPRKKGLIQAFMWQNPLDVLRELRGTISHFGGYLWESKIKPGRYVLSCVPHGFDSVSGLTQVADQWVKPATPKALRFWSTDVAKACTLGFKPWNVDEWPKV